MTFVKIIYKKFLKNLFRYKKVLPLILVIFILFFAFAIKHNINYSISGLNQNTINATTPLPKISTYQVPILMYHYIREPVAGDTTGNNLSVSPENFKQQMEWLKNNNYNTILISDLSDQEKFKISKIINQKQKPVAITFDDGYDNAYSKAFPILKQTDFNATFYIIRDFVNTPRYLTEPQINEMYREGMDIGSHTLNHPDLTIIPNEEARLQIFLSKQRAEDFCYPSGQYNEIVKNLVKEAGYLSAVTTKEGIANQNSDLFELPRIRITNSNLSDFAKKMSAL